MRSSISNPKPSCYMITYAAAVTRRMLPFNHLSYFSIPRLPADWKAPLWLRIEVNLFAGQLYFDFDDYKHICTYLGIQQPSQYTEKRNAWGIDAAGASDSQSITTPRLYTAKPLAFLQDWLAMRRKGQDLAYTPIGYIIHSKIVSPELHFFATTKGKEWAIREVDDEDDSEGSGERDESDLDSID